MSLVSSRRQLDADGPGDRDRVVVAGQVARQRVHRRQLAEPEVRLARRSGSAAHARTAARPTSGTTSSWPAATPAAPGPAGRRRATGPRAGSPRRRRRRRGGGSTMSRRRGRGGPRLSSATRSSGPSSESVACDPAARPLERSRRCASAASAERSRRGHRQLALRRVAALVPLPLGSWKRRCSASWWLDDVPQRALEQRGIDPGRDGEQDGLVEVVRARRSAARRTSAGSASAGPAPTTGPCSAVHATVWSTTTGASSAIVWCWKSCLGVK